ncbi:MAG TPA: HAD hydrolase-like protein [Lentimicrobium sp.]|jgi:phosphoglycolate phosphatase|nr:HAD hydrolase-like protein [Lentimicrobium sp.]
MFSHIFFDLDGTLIDSRPGILASALHTIDTLKVPQDERPEDLTPFIGPPLRHSFMQLFGFDATKAERATEIYREFYGREGMHMFTVYPGIEEQLIKLKEKGLALSLVTSKAWVYAEKIVEEAGLLKYFSELSGCEISGERSEKEELIHYTLEKLGLKPGPQIVMAGDRYHDIRGAKAAGIGSAAVLYGYGSREELENENPGLLIPSPGDLACLLTSRA